MSILGKKASKPLMGTYERDLLAEIYKDDVTSLTVLRISGPYTVHIAGAGSSDADLARLHGFQVVAKSLG